MDSLDHLTLNDNRLKFLGEGYFEGLVSMTTLYIDRNKINLINDNAFIGLESEENLFFA